MQSNQNEARIEDNVIRARSACWVENVYKEAIDVSRYPKIGVAEDARSNGVLFGVVAYKKIDDDQDVEILMETEDENEALDYYRKLLIQLQSGPSVH